MLNQITIHGRLVRDPELRRTQSGTAVASATVACDRDYKNENGEKDTDFIDVVAWRGTGEFLAKYFRKGQEAIVSGRLQIRKWTDNQGNKRSTAEIVAATVDFCGSKSDGGERTSNSRTNKEERPTAQTTTPQGESYAGDFAMLEDEDSELPF